MRHQRQHRADFEPVGGEVFGQCGGEGGILAGPVAGGCARRRGEGVEHVVGSADAAQAGLYLILKRSRHERGGAAPVPTSTAERVVAAGVEQDEANRRNSSHRLAQLLQRQAGGRQRLGRCRVGIAGQQMIAPADLDAVTREEDQRHIGPCAVLAKILDGAAHAAQVAVAFGGDLEAQLGQRVLDGARVVDGIFQRTQMLVAVDADDQRNAPLCGRDARGYHQD